MITNQEIKSTIRGFLLAVFSWFIVLELRETIIAVVPIKNPLIIGIIGVLTVLYFTK